MQSWGCIQMDQFWSVMREWRKNYYLLPFLQLLTEKNKQTNKNWFPVSATDLCNYFYFFVFRGQMSRYSYKLKSSWVNSISKGSQHCLQEPSCLFQLTSTHKPHILPTNHRCTNISVYSHFFHELQIRPLALSRYFLEAQIVKPETKQFNSGAPIAN